MTTDRAFDDLTEREREVDALMADQTPQDKENIRFLHLEKTIILAGKAIVEAIWKARY